MATTQSNNGKRHLGLLYLPHELHLLVISFLPFADIERLRHTCRFYHNLATPRLVRSVLGQERTRSLLLSHCRLCLTHDPFRARLLLPVGGDPGYPLASRCIDCAVRAGDETIRVGRRVNLANFDSVWVCRWCGWPVFDGPAFGHVQFHRECYGRYNDVLLVFFMLGWVQLGIGIAGAGLAWEDYRQELMVFAPTVASFILLWVCLGILVFRGNRIRTYHWTFFTELAILGLWIPPIYFMAQNVAAAPTQPIPESARACLVLFCLNLAFRLLNVLGNIILMCDYDLTQHHRPKIPKWRQCFFNPLMSLLIFWTYPHAVEQKRPPDWN